MVQAEQQLCSLHLLAGSPQLAFHWRADTMMRARAHATCYADSAWTREPDGGLLLSQKTTAARPWSVSPHRYFCTRPRTTAWADPSFLKGDMHSLQRCHVLACGEQEPDPVTSHQWSCQASHGSPANTDWSGRLQMLTRVDDNFFNTWSNRFKVE